MERETQQTHERYCMLMGEIKLRLRSLEEDAQQVQAFGAQLQDQQVFVYERACLQLRKTLELIAFATLAANKDKVALAHPNFAEFWRANKIMAKLRALNPHFYPVPVRETRQHGRLQVMDVKGDHWLLESECSTLIDLCGEALHIQNPFAPTKPADLQRPLGEWIIRIRALLNVHSVALTDDDVILVRMGDWERYGGVELLALRAI